jgi:hypothetical protein
MDDELVTHLLSIAKSDLPQWSPTTVPEAPPTNAGTPNAGPPIEAWERMFERVLETRIPPAPATDTEKAKKPSDAWKGTINILLQLCQVSSEEDLPQL